MAGYIASFKMKPLPKGEYQLMKAMVAHYELKEPSELFAVLLRLAYEEMWEYDGAGQLRIADMVDTYRSEVSTVDHQYTLPVKQTRQLPVV